VHWRYTQYLYAGIMHHKEEPNTKNVKVWPSGFVVPDSDSLSKKARRSSGGKAAVYSSTITSPSSDANDIYETEEEAITSKKRSWWKESYEFSLLFFVGSITWIFVVKTLLTWLRFPFHKHNTELMMIYIIPIVILFLLMNILESFYSSKANIS
jgi:hypothetical protein